jgi:hypothetical protein
MKAISLLLLVLACASHHPHEKGLEPLTYQMKACYEKSVAFKDRKDGIMKIAYTISQEGLTSNPKILQNPFSEVTFDECVLNVIRHSSYPRQMMSMDVIQPFSFTRAK